MSDKVRLNIFIYIEKTKFKWYTSKKRKIKLIESKEKNKIESEKCFKIIKKNNFCRNLKGINITIDEKWKIRWRRFKRKYLFKYWITN